MTSPWIARAERRELPLTERFSGRSFNRPGAGAVVIRLDTTYGTRTVADLQRAVAAEESAR